MQYTSSYRSPLGDILLAADGDALTGLWFAGQKYFALSLEKEHVEKELPVLRRAKEWLNVYFSGHEPDFLLPLRPRGTDFQREVWNILSGIPYGATRTYGDIARELAAGRRLSSMSAQAVGSAVGHNPISVIIPCHRVLGSNGSLTGYAGGIDKKLALLELEHAYEPLD